MAAATKTARAFVGAGGNLGDRAATLSAAATDLAATPGIELVARSALYETRPVGPSTEPFLNAVVELATTLDPEHLLERTRAIEAHHGRQRTVRWGARTLDLDLLLFLRDGALVSHRSPTLTLPHPRMRERDFVLVPLADVAEDLVVADGHTAAELTARLPEPSRTVLRTYAPATAW